MARKQDAQEVAPKPSNRPPTLGESLGAARQSRHLSVPEVVDQTRIPTHYIQMLETDNYGMISDQLYLLPFLRKYAGFLGLDPDEVAARFIRDVQRADTVPVKTIELPPLVEKRRLPWLAIAAAVVAVAALSAAALGLRVLLPHITRKTADSASHQIPNPVPSQLAPAAMPPSAAPPGERATSPAQERSANTQQGANVPAPATRRDAAGTAR